MSKQRWHQTPTTNGVDYKWGGMWLFRYVWFYWLYALEFEKWPRCVERSVLSRWSLQTNCHAWSNDITRFMDLAHIFFAMRVQIMILTWYNTNSTGLMTFWKDKLQLFVKTIPMRQGEKRKLFAQWSALISIQDYTWSNTFLTRGYIQLHNEGVHHIA